MEPANSSSTIFWILRVFSRTSFYDNLSGVSMDHVQLTVTGAETAGCPRSAAVRGCGWNPKPGLPTDPNNPAAPSSTYLPTSTRCLSSTNESGWYEGWMIHDLTVPQVNANASRRRPCAVWAPILQAGCRRSEGNGEWGIISRANIFTMDGNAVHFPSRVRIISPRCSDQRCPDLREQWGALQTPCNSRDVHSYWEFNYTGDQLGSIRFMNCLSPVDFRTSSEQAP